MPSRLPGYSVNTSFSCKYAACYILVINIVAVQCSCKLHGVSACVV